MALGAAFLFYLLMVLRLAPTQSEEYSDFTRCPEECMCSVGALSDLVVQCNGYQTNQANSLLPHLSHDTESFVTRLDIINSKIPILIDDFLNNERSYSKKLRSLRIKKSGIIKINSRAFKSAKNLEEIELEENDINLLPVEVFSSYYCPNLRLLSLSNNINLNFPESGPFLKSHSIEELIISTCGITGVYNHTFSRLPRLVYLNLANNNINFIDFESFSKLHYLEELDLSNNKIIKIPSKLSPTLQTLNLQNNPEFNINSLTDLAPNVAISKLDLSQCNIKNLPREFFSKLHDLTNLNLSHNALSNLYFPFVLRQLHYLDLSYNQLKGPLDKNLFSSCTALETLRLGWNQGLELPKSGFQGDLVHMYLLDLSGCEMTSLPPSSINNLIGLVHLNLSHNEIPLSEDLFQSFSDLNTLDLSFNELSSIPDNIFKENIKLKHLNLASNANLSQNSPVLSEKILENNLLLKSLNIANCDFENVPENLPENITTLIIDNNDIRDPLRLTKLIEKSLLSLQTVSITNNLWKCNFEFKQLIGTLRERRMVDNGKNGTWSDYQEEVCLMSWDEMFEVSTMPREVVRSHLSSCLIISLSLMAFVLISGIITVICKRRISPNSSRSYRQLSDSSNLSTPASTPAVPNKIYKESLESIPKPTTFTTKFLYPRFPVTQSEIPNTSYLSGNYHHKELNP